jgi:hypothetical protein
VNTQEGKYPAQVAKGAAKKYLDPEGLVDKDKEEEKK